MARSQIGDLSDVLKTFPQMSYNEYMYERSIAQINFMATDSTHVKYLKGKDKKKWEKFHEIIKAQNDFEGFLKGGRKENN